MSNKETKKNRTRLTSLKDFKRIVESKFVQKQLVVTTQELIVPPTVVTKNLTSASN